MSANLIFPFPAVVAATWSSETHAASGPTTLQLSGERDAVRVLQHVPSGSVVRVERPLLSSSTWVVVRPPGAAAEGMVPVAFLRAPQLKTRSSVRSFLRVRALSDFPTRAVSLAASKAALLHFKVGLFFFFFFFSLPKQIRFSLQFLVDACPLV
jgi:hypothetical protein